MRAIANSELRSFNMSNQSFMEKLLEGFEVEWKTLGDVFDLRNGYTPSKAKSEYWTMVAFLGLEWKI
jgi:hypothetical protein